MILVQVNITTLLDQILVLFAVFKQKTSQAILSKYLQLFLGRKVLGRKASLFQKIYLIGWNRVVEHPSSTAKLTTGQEAHYPTSKMKKIIKKIVNKKGFVMLFAVTLSAILLTIALGVSDIALKEIRFGTNARDTNDAFFAADTGAECASYYDKSDQAKFSNGDSNFDIKCGDSTDSKVTFVGNTYSFTILGLGSVGASCAKVDVTKIGSPPDTTIISRGYNLGDGACASTSINRVEREIKVDYLN